jgi:hypothetical protein
MYRVYRGLRRLCFVVFPEALAKANWLSAGLRSELRSDAEPAHSCRQAGPPRPLNQEPGWFDLRANGRRSRT